MRKRLAMFGSGGKDVLDVTYRKAGKMDLSNFSLNMNPERSGLADAVRLQMLGFDDQRKIRLEPYKLNVYGKGYFFKVHKDTPRDKMMFGSLVIVLPTRQEGGALKFTPEGDSKLFDSGKILLDKPTGTIAFVAFYGDVDHEVQEVISGHRVMITYNLYFSPTELAMNPPVIAPEDHREGQFKAALSKLLSDNNFLPEGGLLGFGLKHQYPLSSHPQYLPNLETMCSFLKGSDASILRKFSELGLKTNLKITYNVEDCYHILCDDAWGWKDMPEDVISMVNALTEGCGGIVMWSNDPGYRCDTSVTWISGRMQSNTVHEGCFGGVALGNYGSMAYFYGYVSLIVHVGPPGHRDSQPVHLHFSPPPESI
ncbi:hypothetical protein BD410DRAFT_785009 [Rickenella mellea]|uniref:Prolyl 4-hydroxylase alpha subunit Fe(2+) 2OG dioxygenase domain-containing protein n=1 Tax=Rickenella mellea TaxID=50990 RepID=A0A4Y7QD64_9AGAM|nr:hypothetical protein BD410DRAFT_785009 [Rickenella mellea]